MRRALAVFAAVGMVVVAVLVRQAMDDDEGKGDGDGAFVVVCATDLADACLQLGASVEVRVEDPADTAAALDEGTVPDDVDAWITSTAWEEVVDSRAPDSLGRGSHIIAASPTVVATAPGRYEAVTELCRGEDIWVCLGDAAGEDWADLGDGSHADWRELKVGLPDPALATGLPALASVATGFFGTRDFAANDPRFGEFEAWLANLARASADGDPNPALTLATRQGTYSAAGSTEAGTSVLEDRGLRAISPTIPVIATITAVELAGGHGLPNIDPVRRALADSGWSTSFVPDDIPTLKPGVMAALDTLWRQVT